MLHILRYKHSSLHGIPPTFMKHRVELAVCQLQNGCGGEHKAKQCAGSNTSSPRVSCTPVGILQHGITSRAAPPGVTGDEMWLRNVDLLWDLPLPPNTIPQGHRSPTGTKLHLTAYYKYLGQAKALEIYNIRGPCWVAESVLVEFKFSQYLRI